MFCHSELLITSAEQCCWSSLQGSCLLGTTHICTQEISLALTSFRIPASSEMQRGGDTHRGVEEATTVVIKWYSIMNQASSDSEITHWLLLIHILGFQALPPVITTSEDSLLHLLPHSGGPGSFLKTKKNGRPKQCEILHSDSEYGH